MHWGIIFSIAAVVIIGIMIISANSTHKSTGIESCISPEDKKYQLSQRDATLLQIAKNNQNTIRQAAQEAKNTVNLEWLMSYERIYTVSLNLEQNLYYHKQRILEKSKFQYYTSLHFRSMIAADIVYKEYESIKKSYKEINQLLYDVRGHRRKSNMSIGQLEQAVAVLKNLKETFLARVNELNHNTRILRDKIGVECGERGRVWRKERMKNR